MITAALVGNLGNSVMVRGGLEVLLDATADALTRAGVRVVRRLERGAPKPDVFHFFGAFYGVEDGWQGAAGVARVVSPVLLRSDAALSWWRPAVDRARGRVPSSLLHARFRMLREADAVIANSQEEADDSLASGARSADIIRCGVDLEQFVPEPAPIGSLPAEWQDRARQWVAQSRRVISVGRFEKRKNQVAVALACKQLGLPVMFIGRRSPVERETCDELRAATAFPQFVWEDAPFSVLRWAMAHSDVHVLATRHETIGLVSLEAAASGARPVTITQRTSREYFSAYGEFSDQPDPAPLAQAIERALTRGRLQPAERRHLEPVSWAAFAAGTRAVYERVLSA
ncbi:MAG: glycosyltransferase [Archangium sp.]|nr:glycosyltransferase [Archangium sp.]